MTSYEMTLWCCSRPTFRAQCCAPASGTSALSLMGNCLRWKELPPPRLHPPMASLGGLDQVFQSLVHLLPAGTMLRTTPAPELSVGRAEASEGTPLQISFSLSQVFLPQHLTGVPPQSPPLNPSHVPSLGWGSLSTRAPV